MRHRHSGRQLSRNSSHRHAMMRNMATSLLRHETIRTTVPKAKELRRVVEPLITLAKADSLAKRRLAFARLRDDGGGREAVCRARTALQGARRRLHADPEDGAAARRFGRHGADAAGRVDARGGRQAGRGCGSAQEGPATKKAPAEPAAEAEAPTKRRKAKPPGAERSSAAWPRRASAAACWRRRRGSCSRAGRRGDHIVLDADAAVGPEFVDHVPVDVRPAAGPRARRPSSESMK